MDTSGTIKRGSTEFSIFSLTSHLDYEDTSTDNNPEETAEFPLGGGRKVLLVVRPADSDDSEFFTEGDIKWTLCVPESPEWPWKEEADVSVIPEQKRGDLELWLNERLDEIARWFS